MLLDASHVRVGVLLSVLKGLLLFLGQSGVNTSLGLEGFLSLLSVGFVGGLFHSGGVDSVGVEGFHGGFVVVGVDLLGVNLGGLSLFSDGVLDGVGVDDLGNVGVGEDGLVDLVSLLFSSDGIFSSEDLVQSLESSFSVDDESTDVTTWGELSEVKSVDVADVDTGDVSDALDEVSVFVGIDEEGTLSGLNSVVSELSLSGSGGRVVDDSFNIFVGTDSLQESNDVLSLFKTFNLVIDNQRKVRDLADLVASGNDEGSHG